MTFLHPQWLALLALPVILAFWEGVRPGQPLAMPYDGGKGRRGWFLRGLVLLANCLPACLLAVAILIPLWASYLVKIYAWRVILAEEGILNVVLEPLGPEHNVSDHAAWTSSVVSSSPATFMHHAVLDGMSSALDRSFHLRPTSSARNSLRASGGVFGSSS